jgi:hypothetical protein
VGDKRQAIEGPWKEDERPAAEARLLELDGSQDRRDREKRRNQRERDVDRLYDFETEPTSRPPQRVAPQPERKDAKQVLTDHPTRRAAVAEDRWNICLVLQYWPREITVAELRRKKREDTETNLVSEPLKNCFAANRQAAARKGWAFNKMETLGDLDLYGLSAAKLATIFGSASSDEVKDLGVSIVVVDPPSGTCYSALCSVRSSRFTHFAWSACTQPILDKCKSPTGAATTGASASTKRFSWWLACSGTTSKRRTCRPP